MKGHHIFILIILASFGYINWSDITCAGQRFTKGQWSVCVQVKYMVLIDYLWKISFIEDMLEA